MAMDYVLQLSEGGVAAEWTYPFLSYFGNAIDFLYEFVPMFVFAVSLFVYMVFRKCGRHFLALSSRVLSNLFVSSPIVQ